jgi:hypothetical protein
MICVTNFEHPWGEVTIAAHRCPSVKYQNPNQPPTVGLSLGKYNYAPRVAKNHRL